MKIIMTQKMLIVQVFNMNCLCLEVKDKGGQNGVTPQK